MFKVYIIMTMGRTMERCLSDYVKLRLMMMRRDWVGVVAAGAGGVRVPTPIWAMLWLNGPQQQLRQQHQRLRQSFQPELHKKTQKRKCDQAISGCLTVRLFDACRNVRRVSVLGSYCLYLVVRLVAHGDWSSLSLLIN